MSTSSQPSVARLLSAAALVAAPLLAAAQTYNPATCTGADFPVIVNLPTGTNTTIPGGVIGTSTGALGTDAVTWTVEDGGVTVNPNPAYQPNDNFWFYKFDTAECFDITQWNTIEFEYMAPAGSSFGWTMTVHQPSCSLAGAFGCFNATYYCPRGPDTSYHFLNEYTKSGMTDGTWQKLSLPLYDFRVNVADNATDFFHIKDWTFVNMNPVNATYKWRNIKLTCRKDYPSIANMGTLLTTANPNPTGFSWDKTGVDFTGATVGTKVAVNGSTTGTGTASSSRAAAAASTTASGAAAAGSTATASPAATRPGSANRIGGSWSVAALVAGAAVVLGL